MNNNNVVGMIFANIHEEALESLTTLRTMGSVPFCSRYRLIDFPLSNMVESGITTVGVVTNANFSSLMDHVGNGKPWDLDRKNGGLFILPPFNYGSNTVWGNRIDALYRNKNFLHYCNQDYVLINDCNHIISFDYGSLFDFHEERGADITIVGVKAPMPDKIGSILCFDEVAEDGRISKLSLDKKQDGDVFHSVNIILIKKALLSSLIEDAHSRNEVSFQRSVIMKSLDRCKIYAYDATDSFIGTISSVQAYYDVSMKLLEKENRDRLFNRDLPIYTKERDDMPSIYGPDSKLNNSLVADGCIIKGTVQNSIIFKGAKIGKGATVKNSIIMQDAEIGDNVSLNCVIADKNVKISDTVELSGAPNFPVTLAKNARI